ncbi:hypothetical protein CALVIDRAFT_231304 [Calocera viscosa TUFC12733]|uniref:Uncharacterized protein n=1 Tax=Calocera viscosa (strain TUFC12733) TaxID=1330018 RepID=A0A167JX77_CALVF|nr:hypothetical protein CALVIDRAFT_231304 [Calocera viscosa TUFC12733]
MYALLLPLAALLLAQPARAYYCYYDNFNYYTCDNSLSYGARVGIGIGIAALVIAILVCVTYSRRRRIRAQNIAYLQQQPQGQYAPYAAQPPPQGGMGWGYWGGGGGRGVNQGGPSPGNVELGNTGPQGMTGPEYAPPPPNYETATGPGTPGETVYPPKAYQGQGGYLPVSRDLSLSLSKRMLIVCFVARGRSAAGEL